MNRSDSGAKAVSKKKSANRDAGQRKDRNGVRKLPAVTFEDFAQADEVFLAHVESGALMPRSGKETNEGAPPGENVSHSKSGRAKGGKGKRSEHKIDLHGLTVDEAKRTLDKVVMRALATAGDAVTFHVVTGRGIHSGPGGGVLVSEIHRYVEERYGPRIVSIESSPAETQLGGLPWRGSFRVTIGNR